MPAVPDPDCVLSAPSPANRDTLRFLIIPLLVAGAWLAETFLLEGSTGQFTRPDPLPFLAYTIVACILTGIVLPILILRRSFLSGAVTMPQTGFRSPRRTITLCMLAGSCILLVFTLVPSIAGAGNDPFFLFLLLLPTGIASVMICWVLLGTHLQALVRQGGVLIAVTTGVVITALLFALSLKLHAPLPGIAGNLMMAVLAGMITALIFFAFRDVYVASLVLTGILSFLVTEGGGLPGADGARPVVTVCAFLALLALVVVHGYLLRTYTTIRVVPDR